MTPRRTIKQRIARVGRNLVGPELATLQRRQARIEAEQQTIKAALGALMACDIAGRATTCNEAEFRCFSQFGEDGIIEYLVRHCDVSPSTFVEIGVETYAEANTRFLAEHRLWRGLIIDRNPRLATNLAGTNLDWRAQVQAISTFVTRDNVRHVVEPFVGSGGLGLLSVDIDGVDYWVLEQLVDLEPALVVAEYNALFGDRCPVSIPYDSAFDRAQLDYHNVYYGASLAAYDHLLGSRGYALAACNTAGNNAFFVRADRMGDVPGRSVSDAYRARRFVEHRDSRGELTGNADRSSQLQDVARLPLVDVTNGRELTVADVARD